MPPFDLIDRLNLVRPPRTPQGYSRSTIQYPANGKRQDRFTKPLPSKRFERVDRGQILTEVLALELWIDLAEIIASELCSRADLSRKKTAA